MITQIVCVCVCTQIVFVALLQKGRQQKWEIRGNSSLDDGRIPPFCSFVLARFSW